MENNCGMKTNTQNFTMLTFIDLKIKKNTKWKHHFPNTAIFVFNISLVSPPQLIFMTLSFTSITSTGTEKDRYFK